MLLLRASPLYECLHPSLYLRSAGWKLAIQEYVKSYNFAWFSPAITPFSPWKTNYLQALPSFQTTEDAWTCDVFPSVASLADIIPECCKNLKNIFSDWKIAALCFRCVEMLCSSTSKWLFAVFKQDVNPDIFLVLLFWLVRITHQQQQQKIYSAREFLVVLFCFF